MCLHWGNHPSFYLKCIYPYQVENHTKSHSRKRALLTQQRCPGYDFWASHFKLVVLQVPIVGFSRVILILAREGGQSFGSPIIEYQSEYSIDFRLIIGNFMPRMTPNTPTVKLYTPIYSESTQKSYTIHLGLYLQFLGYICLTLFMP